MNVIELSKTPSVVNQFMAEIRDEKIQKDRLRFRENIKRIGFALAYEMSKSMTYHLRLVNTPLAVAEVPVPSTKPVVASILRAGVPLHVGVLEVFDGADNAFISAYRDVDEDHNFEVKNSARNSQ